MRKWAVLLSFVYIVPVCMFVIMGASDNPDDVTFKGVATFSNAIVASAGVTETVKVVVYNTTATTRTILASETGTVFAATDISDDPITFLLPAAAAGLTYTFADYDATAAADLHIDCQSGDQIALNTAAQKWSNTADSQASITVTAVDGTHWVARGAIGTWGDGGA